MKSTFKGYLQTSLYNGPRIRTMVPTEDRFLIQASEFTAVKRNLVGNYSHLWSNNDCVPMVFIK